MLSYSPILMIEQLSFQIGERPILKELNCQIQRGDFILLQGVNGCGKSSLFDLIVGRKQFEQGHIWLEGQLVSKWSETKRSKWISRMSQNTLQGCFPSLTVEENFILASLKGEKASLKKGGHRFDKEQLTCRLEAVEIDLDPLLAIPIGHLSGGQRQLLTFLMATLSQPSLLLLDEPTAALDPTASAKLVQLISNFIEESQVATIMITHDVLLRQTLGNKRWTMQEGKIEEKVD